MSRSIERLWRARGMRAYLLWPISQVYRLLIFIRRLGYTTGLFKTIQSPMPVVVVGNLVVGGTGKTPLTAFLVEKFKAWGWRPAIVTRGYGGHRHVQPHLIADSDTAEVVGDEPLMLSRQTGVPVCVCVKRADAVSYINDQTNCDIVFSDDGLQHLAMDRSATVLVVDGERGFGNRWLLPAGPLRESYKRWRRADLVATQGSDTVHESLAQLHNSGEENPFQTQRFNLQLSSTVSLRDEQTQSIDDWQGRSVVAMAGIGHPARFFNALTQAGLKVTGIAKPDHHVYSTDDVKTEHNLPLLVTSKDAVKLRALGALPVEVFEVQTTVCVTDALQVGIVQLEAQLQSEKLTKAQD